MFDAPLFIGRYRDRARRTFRAEIKQEISDRPSHAVSEVADSHENATRVELRGEIEMIGIRPPVDHLAPPD